MVHRARRVRSSTRELTYGGQGPQRWRYTLRRRPLIRLIKTHTTRPLDCADVGAADGTLGQMLLTQGLVDRYTGFELRDDLRDAGLGSGMDVRPFDAETDLLPGEYGLIICTHLVEHVRDPLDLLTRLRAGLVGETGVLIVATPNTSGLSKRIMGERWIGYGDPTHINLRSHAEWLEVIGAAGFTVRYAGSSYLSDMPLWGAPVALLSKGVLLVAGYCRWSLGNSSIFVLGT